MEEWMRKLSLNFQFSFLLSLSLDNAHGPERPLTAPLLHPEPILTIMDPHSHLRKDWVLVWKSLITFLYTYFFLHHFSKHTGVLVP